MANIKKMYKTILGDNFPETMTIQFGEQTLMYRKRTWQIKNTDTNEIDDKGLRYGENPDQPAAMYELINGNLVLGDVTYIEPKKGLVSALSTTDLLQFGKHPGKINLTDIDSGLNILRNMMDQPAVAVLKHNNPSGVAVGTTAAEAFEKAFMADRLAAMGGAVVFNRPMNIEAAELFSQNYFEVVAAPEFEDGVLEILAQRKNLRVALIRQIENLAEYVNYPFVDFKSLIDGGIIVQQSQLNKIQTTADFLPALSKRKGLEYAIDRKPTKAELDDMLFGWKIMQGVTSNSVIYVKDGITIGIGTGEQDRVGVAKIAVTKAREKYADGLCYREHGIPLYMLDLEIKSGKRPAVDREAIQAAVDAAKGGLIGSAMISDAFFPFRDGADVGIENGVSSICHPGGSLRDFESIQACNEADPKVTMVFTGQRSFRH
ncbi:IMP cyclohydrolase [bacterium]|nr:IMP cyclohydrolase [bacterium]